MLYKKNFYKPKDPLWIRGMPCQEKSRMNWKKVTLKVTLKKKSLLRKTETLIVTLIATLKRRRRRRFSGLKPGKP